MENGRKYKSNIYLIALISIGTAAVVIEIVSYLFFDLRLWYFDLALFIVILLSAQSVYLDARKIDAGKAYPEQKTFRAMTWTPTSWGVLVLVIWIIMFPLYLYKREEIFWQNITVEYSTLKTIEREIKPQKRSEPSSDPSKYSKNVRFCPRCHTPYSIRQLNRTKHCNMCGELLKTK
ncbi:MAG: hypothetical protein JSV09_15235 [Thermoplasmata archaeon]|nr:MAG: hypothetical protein JSV09_15235 [Thermoplasmata archaeon]